MSNIKLIDLLKEDKINLNYEKIKIPKKNGGFRNLDIPNKELKKIQRQILNEILYNEKIMVNINKNCKGFMKELGIYDNAVPHIKKKYVLNIDINNFFGSITDEKTKSKVKDYFDDNEIDLILKFCFKDGILPQGAPTSPMISNIILKEFDDKIESIVKIFNDKQKNNNQEYSYTRYADDITISGGDEIFKFIKILSKKLKYENFSLNNKKTRIFKSHKRQLVTGLVVNQKVNVNKEYYKRLRQELYYISKYGIEDHLKNQNLDIDSESYLKSLDGKIKFVDYYSKKRGEALKKIQKNIDKIV